MKIAILLILLVPILFWITFIWSIFENAVERMKNYNLFGMLASLGFGVLMAYGLYKNNRSRINHIADVGKMA